MVVVETLAKSGEVFVLVPFCEVGIFELLLGLDIEGAPHCVEVVENLVRGGVGVCGVTMLQLGVELLIERIVEVGGDTLQDSLADVPACADAVPLLLQAFARVGGSGFGDRGVVGVGLGLLDVRVNSGLMVVFRGAQNLGE